MKRDLLSLQDLTGSEIDDLLKLTNQLKQGNSPLSSPLKGKTVALLFQKPSNRTRVSFEVGTIQLGGNCLYLGPDEINLGVRESIADVAKTLSRYLSALVARTYTHEDILELARHASIPIINGLSDLHHPCQALADIFSIKEKFGRLKGLTLGYIGDGNNVCHSLLQGCAKVGMHMHIATPPKYEPQSAIVRSAKEIAQKTGAKILTTHSPQDAVQNADIIYADVWVSMGQEKETKKRLKDFKGYQINAGLVKQASKDYVFMHCLPAHRGQEVTAEIIDGPHSIVFDQAENRLHTQKAILITLLGSKS
ncbi:MAG: ornithine carbamoyltransferase [Omnitrophica WOR_2 bacterium RIFCSPHIGHO2_02_FULL_52_10]|nr:MAG: ornithine carbamoyltransferase [Omnitrophica WOR_2 bacterium RIFCSPHIGHO2_02_FULL_52_10]